jgi:hypothetical protein
MNKSGLSNESYDAYIIKEHGSIENYYTFLGENLKVLKLINDQVNWSMIKIDDAAIDTYIAQNSAIFPAEQLNDPQFKEQLYSVARKQMFERQRQTLINEYVSHLVKEKTA